jgi:hypothetical protein
VADLAYEDRPFEDVQMTAGGFSIPELKWRELLFVGALRPDGDGYVRDPDRPLPPFRIPGLFPDGQRFAVTRTGGRIVLRRA